MKKFLSLILVAFAGIITLFAQPQKMTYQAVVRNGNNELVVNNSVGIRVTIVEDVPNGPIIYRETHVAQTNANGLVSVIIGTGTHPYTVNLSDVQWAHHDHYFQVEIDPSGGTNYTVVGTQQLMSVPYSFHSGSAAVADKSDTAAYAVKANTANNANTANTANIATYADTAYYLMNAQNSDTSKFAYHSDTANYTNISSVSNVANYADSARISNFAVSANTATSAQTANCADSTRIANVSNTAISANTATLAQTANYADSSDYNHLANRPLGTSRGDILYWEPNDNSWHIVPVGNIGETLTLDSNYIPHWNATSTVSLPTLATDSVINITTTTARVISTVTSDGGSAFVFSGVCWDTVQAPTIAGYHTLDGIGTGGLTSNLSGLTMGTKYYVRAFATNSAGTAYGNEMTFSTQTYPTVITVAAGNVSVTTAVSGGNVTYDGGAPVTARGICWSTSQNPTMFDSHTSDGTGTGIFISNLTSLNGNTKYYVRAYATNYIGTSYGDTISFTTAGLPPTVNTIAASSITGTTAVAGGNVTDDGWMTVTERGVCWNTTGNPTMADNVIVSGSGTGSFVASITGLTPETMYYFRAYAINAFDTSYGAEESFITQWQCGVSSVTDYDNNIYPTLQLGTQCWMKENLRTTHYSNGDAITLGSSTNSSTPYRYYPNNDVNNVSTYGYLYNWPAVMHGAASSTANPSGVQGVCPKDWHVPSNNEWIQLTDYVSSQSQYWCNNNSTSIAMAFASTIGWTSYSGDCYPGNNPSDNNATGFDALPAGRFNSSGYVNFGIDSRYWCTYENSSTSATYIILSNYNTVETSMVTNFSKYVGLTVRCIKD